ncbi:DUF1127 domain-containing protein [Tropicibacter alexandrii]|uniref:DUF1127 domain-containing protein n=1 Tax=Tropicibacter alexandrii TaxID=2267683 RepID=UPI000EF53856|nr:DUF1127 domain-containing protein [Tropicibacter alexandrii]
MAHIQTAAAPHGNFFANLYDGFIRAMVNIAESNSRVKRVEALQALSDAELAARGLKRDDIVKHVFGDVMYL